MLRIHRTEGRGAVAIDGRSFALVSKTWTIRLATPWLGLGYSYRRPTAVEGTSRSMAIRDHVMVARIAALLLMAAGALISRRRQ